jgi:hypothetical protein
MGACLFRRFCVLLSPSVSSGASALVARLATVAAGVSDSELSDVKFDVREVGGLIRLDPTNSLRSCCPKDVSSSLCSFTSNILIARAAD